MAPAPSSACITGQYLGEHHGSQAMNLHDSFFIRLVLKAHFDILGLIPVMVKLMLKGRWEFLYELFWFLVSFLNYGPNLWPKLTLNTCITLYDKSFTFHGGLSTYRLCIYNLAEPWAATFWLLKTNLGRWSALSPHINQTQVSKKPCMLECFDIWSLFNAFLLKIFQKHFKQIIFLGQLGQDKAT